MPSRQRNTPATLRLDIRQSVTDIPKPLWNSAPNELPPYLIKLGEWLLQDADFASLITNGTVLAQVTSQHERKTAPVGYHLRHRVP